MKLAATSGGDAEAGDAEKLKAGEYASHCGSWTCLLRVLRVLLLNCCSPRPPSLAALPCLNAGAECEDVGAVLEELREKVAELNDLIAQNTDTKNMIKVVPRWRGRWWAVHAVDWSAGMLHSLPSP